MDDINYTNLQNELRRAWEQLEYTHLWLTGSDWDKDTDIDDKLADAQVKARAYLELVDRLAWMMRRG
jgi:hypothetical protein